MAAAVERDVDRVSKWSHPVALPWCAPRVHRTVLRLLPARFLIGAPIGPTQHRRDANQTAPSARRFGARGVQVRNGTAPVTLDFDARCHVTYRRLMPLVATAGLHKGSILSCPPWLRCRGALRSWPGVVRSRLLLRVELRERGLAPRRLPHFVRSSHPPYQQRCDRFGPYSIAPLARSSSWGARYSSASEAIRPAVAGRVIGTRQFRCPSGLTTRGHGPTPLGVRRLRLGQARRRCGRARRASRVPGPRLRARSRYLVAEPTL